MPRARKQLIDPEVTPYYHLVSRCVRRAFLCGYDPAVKKSYEHRKDWIEQRLRLLSSIFAIDVCAYAIMSNHYHLVVHLNSEESNRWTPVEVAKRWQMLFKGGPLLQRFTNYETINAREREELDQLIDKLRARLVSVSWFMKCLNESIARQANLEDDCTGHFWEARFKSQALKTQRDVLACMAYVDLNPVRAGIADAPDSALFTSARERVKPSFNLAKAIQEQCALGMPRSFDATLRPLARFCNEGSEDIYTFKLPFSRQRYFELLEWTGCHALLPEQKKTFRNPPPLLSCIGLSTKAWLDQAHHFERWHAKNARALV